MAAVRVGGGGGRTLSSRETTSFSRRCFFVWNGFASKLADKTNTQTNTHTNKAFVRQDGRAGAGCVAADGE